jgi:hypothetical protein
MCIDRFRRVPYGKALQPDWLRVEAAEIAAPRFLLRVKAYSR